VNSARIMTDRETGRSRGFAFVEMENENEANNAINALNGYNLDGRNLNVNEARPKPDRGFGGGWWRRWTAWGGGGRRPGGGGGGGAAPSRTPLVAVSKDDLDAPGSVFEESPQPVAPAWMS
jgi:RNA recognition motif-containing protein